jgi:hypothetical protein
VADNREFPLNTFANSVLVGHRRSCHCAYESTHDHGVRSGYMRRFTAQPDFTQAVHMWTADELNIIYNTY